MVTIIQGDYAKITTRLSKTFKNEYFDFNFSFTDENEVFREINRFIWESKHLMTRFKNRYYGSVAISLSEWNNETPKVATLFNIIMYHYNTEGVQNLWWIYMFIRQFRTVYLLRMN